MAIDSIGLLAQQSYAQIQERPKVENSAVEQAAQAVEFQRMVDKQFNSFAQMTPEQILSRIQTARGTGSAATISTSKNVGSMVGSAADTLRGVISTQEDVARKSLIGEASLVDLLTATTEAKNVMDTTVRVRDKFLEAFEKVMNMSM